MILTERRDAVERPLGQAVDGVEVGVEEQAQPVAAVAFGVDLPTDLVHQVEGHPERIGGPGVALEHPAGPRHHLRPLPVAQDVAVDGQRPGAEVHGDGVEGVALGGGGVAVAPGHGARVVDAPAELRARPPRAVPEPEGVDRDLLAGQDDRAHVATRLVEVGLPEIVGGRDGVEHEIDPDGAVGGPGGVGVVVGERVAPEGLHAAVGDAVGERDVGQWLVGDREVPELAGVEDVRRGAAGVVPEERPGREHALIGPEERVELPRQPALGDGEGEPAGLGPVRVVAGRRVELVVWVLLAHRCPP